MNISFEWWGECPIYRWIRAYDPKFSHPPVLEPFLVQEDARGGRAVPIFCEHSALYRIFAETPWTEEAILTFANKYGWLGKPAPMIDPAPSSDFPDYWNERGESLQRWLVEIATMKRAVQLWDLLKQDDQQGLAQLIQWKNETVLYCSPEKNGASETTLLIGQHHRAQALHYLPAGDVVEPAWFALQDFMNRNLGDGLSPQVEWDNHRLNLAFRPSSLLGALWLQFAQVVVGDLEFRNCVHCGKPFTLSPGTARTNRRHCSESCKTLAYRKRKKERAKEPST